MKNKILFVFALLCANLFSLPQVEARIIYLNTENINTSDETVRAFSTATQVWVQFWQYPKEYPQAEGGLYLEDGTKKEMYQVNPNVWAVEIGDLDFYTHLLFSTTDITANNYDGKTIDLELPEYFTKGDPTSKNCFFMGRNGWEEGWAWDVQQFFIKHGWNGGNWTWQEMTHNGDGTYSYVGIYGGDNGCNYNKTNSDTGNHYENGGTNNKIGSPSSGNRCIFTFNPLANHKFTITKGYWLRHNWNAKGIWDEWRPLLTCTDNINFSLIARYGGSGCAYETNNDPTWTGTWVNSPTTVGSPSVGDWCTFNYNSSNNKITITKITPSTFYLKHPWGGGNHWAWAPLSIDNHDGTYSLIARWGDNGCNFNADITDTDASWVAKDDLNIIPEVATKSGYPDISLYPNAGDFCRFTLNPSSGSITVEMLGHEMVDAETWKIYFTCGYDENKNYYWGDTYENEATVYGYMYDWIDGGTGEPAHRNHAWPGVQAKYCGQNEFGQCVYMMPKKIYDHVLFNNGLTTNDPGWHQTYDIYLKDASNTVSQYNGAPVGYYLNGWEAAAGSSFNTVGVWNPMLAQPDTPESGGTPQHMHYWICKHCDHFIHDYHDLKEGCLKCSRLDLDNKDVPTKLNTGDYKTVNLNRTFKAGYSTIALPFTVESVTDKFGANAFAAYFESAIEPDGTGTGFLIRFAHTNRMEANKPYILYAPAQKAEPQFNNVSVVNREETVCSATNSTRDTGNWRMCSNYTVGKSMEGLYGVANNKAIKRGSSTATLNAYAAYLKFEGAGVPSIRGWDEDLEDGVILIDNEQLTMDNAVYDLSGRKVGSMNNGQWTMDNGQWKRGIYIVNGKKIVK